MSQKFSLYDDGDYKKTTLGTKKTNTLLVRSVMGKVKSATRTLPPVEYTYGKKNLPDEKGAAEVCGR